MIQISDLRKAFGDRVIFGGADLRVGARDRIALVGPNGSGKTTLIEMIMGLQEPDDGRIDMPRDLVLGYLPQETDALRGRSILDEVLAAAPAVAQAGHRLEVLQRELAEAADDERDELLAEYATLQARFEDLGGYSAEADAARILAGLGFRDDDLVRRTETLSGGWLMRVALAKLLLSAPDVLLLDEPTNHLDVESVEWLEAFLRDYPGSAMLISHDRDFINGMAGRIVEIERAKLVSYTGDYASFVEQREMRARQVEAAAKQQQRRVEQLEVFINRFRYKNTKARQVQSKIKMLERMDKVDAAPQVHRTVRFGFPPPPRAGRVVLELDGVGFSYGDKPVYADLTVAVERGQKVALVGPNGAGKTTLLKLFAGLLGPSAGERRLGHNVALGYFAQHQIEALTPTNRVIEELSGAIPRGAELKPRNLLGRFLFSGGDIDKPVSVLSGGERSRLALAKLLVQPFNVLCLDEPTNHLDIASRDVLEDALEDYQGALVFITHDRHLIRSVADVIFEVRDFAVRVHPGDYESYLWRKQQEGAPPPAAQKTPSAPSDAKARRKAGAEDRARAAKQRNAIRGVERELEAAQAERDRLAEQLADPAFYAAGDGVAEVVRAYDQTEKAIKALEAQWERLTEAAEAL